MSGLALVIAAAAVGIDQLSSRNLIALRLPLGLVIAAGLGSSQARRLGIGTAASLYLIGATTTIAVSNDWRMERPDWRSVAHALGRSSPQRAIFVLGGCQVLPLSRYVPGLHAAPGAGAPVSEVDAISVGAPVWYDACVAQPRFSVPRSLAGWHASPVKRIDQFAILRLRSARSERVTHEQFARAGEQGDLLVQH